ncbi:MAG: hypothetical protein PF569_03810 [Candidatus Woesearchaeota archaeon]|jgi:hypothetical protein|nr:hypothetical protein [Candidatus Woesearchaeota archaeon]
MTYNIRKNGNAKEAIFDETGKQVSEWWNYIYPDGLVYDQSDFYLAGREDGKEAIFHKSGIQISEWWYDIKLNGLVSGTSNDYIVENEKHEFKTLTFDKTKFIMDQLKNKIYERKI